MIGPIRCSLLTVAILILFTNLAQAGGTGGIALTLSVETSVQGYSNPALNTVNPQRLNQTNTAFRFGLFSETRSQHLALKGGLSLRASGGAGAGTVADGAVDPFLAIQYFRQARDASLTFDASVKEADLIQMDATAFGPALPIGTARRRQLSAELNLKWRENAPLGFGILAASKQIKYKGGTAIGQGGQALSGTTRQRIDLMARLDLNRVSQLTTTLGYRVFNQETVTGRRESYGFDTTYQIDRPSGPLAFKYGYVSTESGHRMHAMIERSISLPDGAFRVGAGIGRTAGGDRHVIGHLNYHAALPFGGVETRLKRALASSDQDDSEQINTEFGVGVHLDVTPLDRLLFRLDWAEAGNTLSGLTTMNRAIAVSYARTLTRDATFNIGLRRRGIRDTVTGAGRSNEVFISLTRNFETRY